MLGRKEAIEENIQQDQRELKKPQYVDIDDNHRGVMIDVKTTEMAATDLDRYYRALDKYVSHL